MKVMLEVAINPLYINGEPKCWYSCPHYNACPEADHNLHISDHLANNCPYAPKANMNGDAFPKPKIPLRSNEWWEKRMEEFWSQIQPCCGQKPWDHKTTGGIEEYNRFSLFCRECGHKHPTPHFYGHDLDLLIKEWNDSLKKDD